MTDLFTRVQHTINRLRDVLKCQKCLELKKEDSMLFYRSCDHFYCLECMGERTTCLICDLMSEKPMPVVNDRCILSLYQSLVKFELPSKNDIDRIYESCIDAKKTLSKNAEDEDESKNENQVKQKKNVRKSKEVNMKENVSCTEKKVDAPVPVPVPSGEPVAEKFVTPVNEKGVEGNVTSSASSGKQRRSTGRGRATPLSTRNSRGRKVPLDVSTTPVGSSLKSNIENSTMVTPNTSGNNSAKAFPMTPMPGDQSSAKGTPTAANSSLKSAGKTTPTAANSSVKGEAKTTPTAGGGSNSTVKGAAKTTPISAAASLRSAAKTTPTTAAAANSTSAKGSAKATPATTAAAANSTSAKGSAKATPTTTAAAANSTSAKGTAKTTPTASKVNINKRNPKGETQLHLACKKSNFTAMKELIDAGANPNAKDNAGWTPLHDSVFSGNAEVIKFLLDNGAKVNVPGLENTTALHEAIAKGNAKVVQLLLDYGADVNAMNIFRETPLDLVNKYNLSDLKDVLLKASNAGASGVSEGGDNDDSTEVVIVHKHNLTIEDEKLVNKFTENFNVDTITSLTGKISPTHIVVSSDRLNVTWGLVVSVLTGCWVVTIDWVKDSLREDSIKPARSYELSSDKIVGFQRARRNRRNQLPGLFSGCHFFFGGHFDCYTVNSLTVRKDDLKTVVESNGGTILKRCPDPESLALEKTIPYHANNAGTLRETSYFIIYQSDKWDPKPRYNMSHMKTLPIDWLASCIYKFELIDPAEYSAGQCEFL